MLHAKKSYNIRIQDNAYIIPKDEPVFLLRGQDVIAPVLLDIYVALTKNIPNFDSTIVDAVTKHADKMREWQDKIKSKTADMDITDSIYKTQN